MSQQINLYNPAFRKQQTHFSLMTMLQSMAAVLAGSLLMYAYAVHQVSELEYQSAQGAKRLNVEQTALAGYSAGFSPQQANELLKNELSQLEKKALEASQLLELLRSGAVGNTAGYSEYMRAFSRQIVPGLWLTNFKVSGTQLSLNGAVVTPELVPAYLQKLKNEAAMQGKSFSDLQMKSGKDTKFTEFTLYSTVEEESKSSNVADPATPNKPVELIKGLSQ
jgi:Tfp pilus assembly protein PilN